MRTFNFLMIFDIIIVGYGLCIIFAALKMNRTKQPAGMLIPEEDLVGSKDPNGFCEAMYKKTLAFGILCMLYGLAGTVNELIWKFKIVNIIALTVFIVVVLWFCREMRNARHTYIK